MPYALSHKDLYNSYPCTEGTIKSYLCILLYDEIYELCEYVSEY